MKAVMNYVRRKVTDSLWELRWHKFITRIWLEEASEWNWDAKNAVYAITIPKSHQEYIGVVNGRGRPRGPT